jgi:hypothetical protein
MNTMQQLAGQLEGTLYYDNTMRTLYATDASAYRELPLAVAMPKSVADIKETDCFMPIEKNLLDSPYSRHSL